MQPVLIILGYLKEAAIKTKRY